MERLVDKIIESFIHQGIVASEDKGIYAYGLHQGGFIIINMLTYFLISILFNMLLESLLFFVCYIPLRSYAGGYHAKTQIRCYFLSILMITLVLLAIKTVPWTSYIIIGLTISNGSIVFILAPVEDSNKPLSDSQRKVFRKVARTILLLESTIVVLLLYYGYFEYCITVVLGLMAREYKQCLCLQTTKLWGLFR